MGGAIKSVIDIGSNSVKLRVARLRKGQIEVLLDTTEVVRLGRRTADGRLRDEAFQNGLRVVEEMVRRSQDKGAEPLLVGTMALRMAKNASDFSNEILARTGIELTVLSGEEEARLAWKGALYGLDRDGAFVVFDTGGGSTEFVFGARAGIRRSTSIEVGAVSLMERYFSSDPVAWEDVAQAQRHIRDLFAQNAVERLEPQTAPSVIGLGGGVVAMASVKLGLAAFVPLKLNGMKLTREDVEGQMERYAALSLDERRRIRGLPPSRADLILGSACIVLCAMEALAADSLTVSINGLRQGLLVEAFEADGYTLR